MIRDIYTLISEYKLEMERLDHLCMLMNEKFGEVVQIHFNCLEKCVEFWSVLQQDIGTGSMISFENRCPLCHDSPVELWSYRDTAEVGLTVSQILDFVIYLKSIGKLCQHEKVSAIAVNNILICCILNQDESGNTVQGAETQSPPRLDTDIRR